MGYLLSRYSRFWLRVADSTAGGKSKCQHRVQAAPPRSPEAIHLRQRRLRLCERIQGEGGFSVVASCAGNVPAEAARVLEGPRAPSAKFDCRICRAVDRAQVSLHVGPYGFECSHHRRAPRPFVERIRRKALLSRRWSILLHMTSGR